MVNVVAPYLITQRCLDEMKVQPRRIINTSSISHTDCQFHLHRLDYKNLQFEKGNCWTPYDSYGLSKLLVIMFTRGLWHLNKTKKGKTGCTLINMDPGTVNTKMLKAGWGECDAHHHPNQHNRGSLLHQWIEWSTHKLNRQYLKPQYFLHLLRGIWIRMPCCLVGTTYPCPLRCLWHFLAAFLRLPLWIAYT